MCMAGKGLMCVEEIVTENSLPSIYGHVTLMNRNTLACIVHC